MDDEIQIQKRILKEAHFMVNGQHTIRTTAKFFGVGKSTVHRDLSKKLKNLDGMLYLDVQKVIQLNKMQRPEKCGIGMQKRKEKIHAKCK